MKIVVAMDSFKGSLPAEAACRVVARGLYRARPEVELALCPLADGGEGTGRILTRALSGEWHPLTVTGPLPETTADAGYSRFADGLALVETAQAAGLALLGPDRLDPLAATTRGVGELMRAAFDRGARRLWLAVGGSASVDGGTGAARAMGWKLLDGEGREVPDGGGHLTRIRTLRPPSWYKRLRSGGPAGKGVPPPIEVLCDVTNPLLGPRGAAPTFAPQKGADPDEVERLESGLVHLAEVVRKQLGLEIGTLPGGGAAGGLAAGAAAFLGAELRSGARRVLDAVSFPQHLRRADWVLTGEGCLDASSLDGKVVSAVLDAAERWAIPVSAVAGTVELSPERWRAAGLASVAAARPPRMTEREALARARELLERAAHDWARDCLPEGR